MEIKIADVYKSKKYYKNDKSEYKKSSKNNSNDFENILSDTLKKGVQDG